MALQERNEFYLKGGGIQIVLDPNDLVRTNVSKREATPWGLVGDTKAINGGYTDDIKRSDQTIRISKVLMDTLP